MPLCEVLGAGAGADITTSGNGGNHMVYGLVGAGPELEIVWGFRSG